jgi:hypothetical protein
VFQSLQWEAGAVSFGAGDSRRTFYTGQNARVARNSSIARVAQKRSPSKRNEPSVYEKEATPTEEIKKYSEAASKYGGGSK